MITRHPATGPAATELGPDAENRPQRLGVALEEHELMYDAICEGDGSRAEALVRGHVTAGLKVVVSFP
jgi:DNA-binding GntR family transcriptional regulator